MFNTQLFDIRGVQLIDLPVFRDGRGHFLETYQQEKLVHLGIKDTFCQDNESCSSQGILRGLHLQKKPKAQAKLVRVVSGEIYDVAVDIDPSSETFGEWVGQYLSADNPQLFYVPSTCAHGFYVLSETAVVSYKCSDFYAPDQEISLKWDDPDLKIKWPLDGDPIVSPKDSEGVSWDFFKTMMS